MKKILCAILMIMMFISPASALPQTDTVNTPVTNLSAQEQSVQYGFMMKDEYLRIQGNRGRLVIPERDISICLNQGGVSSWQYYTDLSDSGAYIDFWSEFGPYVYDPGYESYYDANNVVLIADHSNQQFGNLFNAQVGDKAYILNGDSIRELTCYMITPGHNTGDGLYNLDGTPVYVYDGYITYTCAGNDGGYSILIAYWH